VADFAPLPILGPAKECGRFLALEPDLTAYLGGDRPVADAAERLSLARLCAYGGRDRAAVRLFREAIAEGALDRGDAEDDAWLGAANLALAARAAARNGQAAQAVAWLRGAMERWEWLLARPAHRALWALTDLWPPAHEALPWELARWTAHPDFASIRDENRLGDLSETDREACRRLWAEVRALRDRVK
jgi:hypothetical protein